ncbi:MAG: MFS transporter [Candidatus Heimdallarchaeota archaeon]|nr:MAG: MFS transporter [Candidatus Heimdallarchaeota archaeon]
MGNILSSYIFLIANESNELLGLTSAITGLAMTMTVLPAGYFSDRFPRDRILRGASIVGFIGLVCALLATDIIMIFVALLFWGLFQGMNRPSLEAIFADSVESGNRSRIYAWNHLSRQIAMASGPFVNIILFLFLGDVWEIQILKIVMISGLLISMSSLAVMNLFDDKKSLGKASEHLDIVPTSEFNSNDDNNMFRGSLLITIILLISNLIIGFGAGMTIKFFPIFFMKQYNLTPIPVQLIMGTTSIITGFTSIFAQRSSLKRGRAEMIFIVQGIATVCLFVISFYPPIIILVPIFLARGSLMNASQPLSRSILMDVVPKRNRGKVNSLQALAWGMFWNFSAAIGGFLIGPSNNFRSCFIVTTSLYVIGTLLILVIIPFVAKEKHAT